MISKYSIAVLPFMNMSSDPENEYFSDGITDEIINALAKIEGLHVTARTSSFAFKNLQTDVREIGKNLNVSLILEGSIRKSGNQVRITAQLINAADGYHSWSESWDRELKNIFILQDEIAGIIAKKINANIQSLPSAKETEIENTAALEYYLRGIYLQYQWDFRQTQQMITCFEKAVEIEPRFAKAYIALCNAFTWMGSTGQTSPMEAHVRIEHYLSKALELDKDLADIYIIIAGKNFWIEWNNAEALRNINQALQLRPSSADALQQKGLVLASMGNIQEALDCFFQAERLNPFAANINFCIGMIYNLTHECLKALEYLDYNIKIAPQWHAQYSTRLEVLCKLGRHEEAWQIIRQQQEDPSSPLSIPELKSYYYASKGLKDEANEQIDLLLKNLESNPLAFAPYYSYIASAFMLMDDHEKALNYLELGIKNKSVPLLFIKIDNLWEELRTHPRYLESVRSFLPDDEQTQPEAEFRKYRKTSLPGDLVKRLQISLKERMDKEKLYLDPRLNLSDLAELIQCTNGQLSQLLNEQLGKNFYDFINEYRLQHFLALNKDPKNKQFTLLSLAYESGFNSKTTFNSFFKKKLGITPSEYFRQ